jgi:hypothetical protein
MPSLILSEAGLRCRSDGETLRMACLQGNRRLWPKGNGMDAVREGGVIAKGCECRKTPDAACVTQPEVAS